MILSLGYTFWKNLEGLENIDTWPQFLAGMQPGP